MPKLMSRPQGFLFALTTITLLNVSILGCAQDKFARPVSKQNVDCRSCHVRNLVAGARDFSSIYANPSSHHSVGVLYPLGSKADPNFDPPNGRSADTAFFDKNDNGQLDSDEIQLFGKNGLFTVECATCHKEHGSLPAPGKATTKAYLRFDNAGSALCLACHSQQ